MDIIAGDGISGTYVRIREGKCLHTGYNVKGAIIFYRVEQAPDGRMNTSTEKAMAFEIMPGRDPSYDALCLAMRLTTDERAELEKRWAEIMDV
jgi:hypothetical protein